MGQFFAGLGFLLSPRALIAVGQGLGVAGSWFWALLILLGAVFWVTSGNIALVLDRNAAGGRVIFAGRSQPLTGELALGVCLGARLGLYLFFSASLLGLAGYAFNEIFWSSFPNLAFSFSLLGIILGLNILAPAAALTTQVLAASICGAALLMIALLGLGATPAAAAAAPPAAGGLLRLAAMLPLLAGFDLARFAPDTSAPGYPRASMPQVLGLRMALVTGGLVLVVWALISARLVDPAKLAETTVPHLLVARMALGTAGRTIMGAVIILGALAAVQVLLWSVALPAEADRYTRRPMARIWSILALVLAEFLLLALGYAGEPLTESCISGALALLMVGYALFNLARLLVPQDLGRNRGVIKSTLALAACLLLAMVALVGSAKPLSSLLLGLFFGMAGILARFIWKRHLPS